MKPSSALLVAVAAVVLASCGTSTDSRPETRPLGDSVLPESELAAARKNPDFEKHVRPILEERCLHCHNGRELPDKFDLTTRETAFRDPRIIVPGDASSSLLIIALTTGNHALTMPAVGTAPPPEEVAVLESWINAGAKWPEGAKLRSSEDG